jgi:hypothetical protein
MVGGRRVKAAAIVLLGFAGADPSFAESAECLHFGYELENLETESAVSLGRINNLSPRVNFVKREAFQKGCPNSSAACKDKAYLVPGDEVIISGSSGDFVCASYADRKGMVTEGWLPRAAIALVEGTSVGQSDGWIGHWRSGPEQTIVIEAGAGQGKLKIRGDATWGASNPERVKRGAVNIGSLEGEAAAKAGNLSFGMGENGTLPYEEADKFDCRAQMRRLGSYLLVKDNGMCGGHNVTFTGIYRRR